MPRLEPANLFVKQNFWVKLSILLLGSVAAVAVPVRPFGYLIAISLVYFIISPSIIRHMLAGFTAILPFLAAYALFATILSVPFPEILMFVVRMIVLVFLLVYFVVSLNIHRLLEDIQPLKSHILFHTGLFYGLSTLLYLKQLVSYYKSGNVINQTAGKKQNLIAGLVDAIHANWQLRDSIQAETDALLSVDYRSPCFVTKYNVLGCIYITLIILVMSL